MYIQLAGTNSGGRRTEEQDKGQKRNGDEGTIIADGPAASVSKAVAQKADWVLGF